MSLGCVRTLDRNLLRSLQHTHTHHRPDHHHTTRRFPPKRSSFVAFCVKPQRLMMDVERDAGSGTGSARRRRERRLRSMLRHEPMSVAMALAESTHQSAQRQKTARAGGEARVVLHGHVPEAPLPQGSRPSCLGEPRGPQDQDQLRTMEQAAAYAPMVQILDIPVPQLVDQLADVMRFFDTLQPVPEQAIEVPKILLDDVPVRTTVRDTQLVEQLVEVPTIMSYSSLQRTVEQHVDIPVPGGGVRHTGLQGFLRGQSSTATPSSKKGIFERIVEQIVDPVSSGRLQLVLENSPMSLVKGFFALFPKLEKVRSRVRTRVRECPPVPAHPRRLLSPVFVSSSGS